MVGMYKPTERMGFEVGEQMTDSRYLLKVTEGFPLWAKPLMGSGGNWFDGMGFFAFRNAGQMFGDLLHYDQL